MRQIDRRLGLLFCGFLVVFSFALLRSFWLQGVQGGSLRAEAHSQQVTTVTIPGQRGRVLDRDGKVLAASEDAADVIATPYQVKNPGQTALRLHHLLGVPTTDLSQALADRNSGFAYLARKVDAGTAARVKKLDIAGISTVPTSRRLYPQGDLASQVIGAVGTENQGLTGIEHSENGMLGGANGEQDIVHDALGRPLRMETVTPPSVGEDVQTTIDAAIQDKTEKALSEAAQQYQAKGAAAIVMNPNTGEVLAMANWPTFDPNDLAAATSNELENRATGFTYEPGSTFKAFTVASALSDHVVTPHSSFYLPSEIHVYDRTIGEAEPRGPVTLTTAQILAQSSNVGAVTIGMKEGATRFSQWISRFGFGRPTGLDFPGEERGIVPSLHDYSGSTMGNLPIGQGLAVTPMQMATAYTAIANHGVMRRPFIVKGDQPPPKRVLTRTTAEEVSHMLEGVLAAGGTAQEAQVDGYTLAGKTGTAEKAIKGGYSKTDFIASFIGFAPAKNPRLLVAVMVDTPRGDIYGGTVAAPAFERIMEFALPYLKIPPR
jgi:cell division protein FtsI (penicillin-binding protein 3)